MRKSKDIIIIETSKSKKIERHIPLAYDLIYIEEPFNIYLIRGDNVDDLLDDKILKKILSQEEESNYKSPNRQRKKDDTKSKDRHSKKHDDNDEKSKDKREEKQDDNNNKEEITESLKHAKPRYRTYYGNKILDLTVGDRVVISSYMTNGYSSWKVVKNISSKEK